MKFTLSWLKDHLDTDASLDEIVEALTMIGLEVEGVEDPGAKYAPFVIGHVLEARQHPNADRLRVCMVDTGTGAPIQVVCGAPNARTGLKGVFAPAGTHIPGTGIDLAVGTIRGVESHGMLCSERELELSNDHTGIIDLPEDAPVGTPYPAYAGLDDPVIDIAITPNRPDCLGVHGVARDLAAYGIGKMKDIRLPAIKGSFQSPIAVDLRFSEETANACPAFAGRYVRGLANGQSPGYVQKRLRAIGLRPINALVDITNYISYDRGRPLHVYDADKVEGVIHARLGKTGEKYLALDGRTYEADEAMCVIADDSGVLGFGGIMGGEDTGCTEATKNVFIESALFDPLRTAETGRRTGIISDARYRFERGVDPAFMLPGIELATQMVMDFCGGEPSDVVVAGKAPESDLIIDFPFAEVKRLSGLDLKPLEIKVILQSLGFWVSGAGDVVKVAVPSWRPDVHGKADLVEEVARIAGVNKIVPTPTPGLDGVARPVLTLNQTRTRRARRALAMRGMVEAVTWSFIAKSEAEAFGGGARELELANPISSEMSDMRPSLLAGLMLAAQRNADRGIGDVALFEVGQIYRGDKPKDQLTAATGIRRGTAGIMGSGRHWQGAAPVVDAFEAKADALALLEALGLNAGNVQIAASAPDWFHPGRSGTLQLGPQTILGHFGEIHPRVLDKLDVAGPMVGFELFLEMLPAPKAKATRAKPPFQATAFQAVRRDFAFVVERDVTAAAILRAARGVDKKLIVDASVFDLFEGASIGEGRKSVAIEVTLQPTDKTMTDEEIEAVAKKIVAAVVKTTGGTLRA